MLITFFILLGLWLLMANYTFYFHALPRAAIMGIETWQAKVGLYLICLIAWFFSYLDDIGN